jgi:Flp pilus assembly protein TadD
MRRRATRVQPAPVAVPRPASGITSPPGTTGVPVRGSDWASGVILCVVCVLVVGFFAWSARSGFLEAQATGANNTYYNLLVQGFRAGQLNLKAELPTGFTGLPDPYDPHTNQRYRYHDGNPLHDLSYYHGKLYLYFGVTPALVLFWPYAALTGHYLLHKDAVVIFCTVGFLASFGLLCAVWRHYFSEIGLAVVAAGTLALGLATFLPVILPRCDVYEVAISCGYALTMLALLALWGAFQRPHRRGRWLAAASLAYGLAIGARPSLLFGAVILLFPVAQAWRARQQVWVAFLAATGPILFIGLGLMLYNTLRFGNPLEFGLRYELSAYGEATQQHFSPRYLWFNFRVFFLEPAQWSGHFPFVHDIAVPSAPTGYIVSVEHPFGVLTNIPIVWLALAGPLVWRSRLPEARSILCWFLAAAALFFGLCALTLCLHNSACIRYQGDFVPALMLLAVVGIFGLERALAGRPVWRRAARWVWGLLLTFSLAFNLLASINLQAEYHSGLSGLLFERGQMNEAFAHLQEAVRLQPYNAEAHNSLGVALVGKNEVDEGISQYQEAIRLKPDYAKAHYNLGIALVLKGQIDEAIRQYREAIRLKPDLAGAHNGLGVALGSKGQIDEAVRQLQEALRSEPDDADTHFNLGTAFYQLGRLGDAIHQFQEAIRLKPGHAEAHSNLGTALGRSGQTDEAIRQFQEALRLKPDYPDARKNLDVMLATKAHSAPPPGASANR